MIQETRLAAASLCIYRGILNDPVVSNYIKMLDSLMDDSISGLNAVNCYYEFLYSLAETGLSFKDYLLDFISHDSNPFSRKAELQEFDRLDPVLVEATQRDLVKLQQIYEFDWGQVAARLADAGVSDFTGPGENSLHELMPGWAGQVLGRSSDWSKEIARLADYYHNQGTGLVSRYRALRWDRKTERIIGIEYPDPVRLSDLVGYKSQKEQLCRNTEQLLQGCPANNVLLYGSRGTGKSTMVKALLNEYGDQGLRLVEIACEDLGNLPEIISFLRQHTLKYIIFIDDLSFEDYETRYKGLKAVMEGSVESRPANVLLYATSNRRHLIREFHSERSGVDDEIHTNDTVQEKLSLADRFGLTITFPSPTQQVYLEIVETIAAQRELTIDPELLRRKALQWERAHHGPSGRTARQFVDSLGDNRRPAL
ncbi:MAG: ATP-binding protein [Syntrophomonadaceae bacterium]|jgi:predicted AAA+ superfamily ATPase